MTTTPATTRTAAERSAVYLSRDDVIELAHYAHPLPVTRGHSRRFVADRYPGWQWNDLLPVIHRHVPLSRRPGEFSERHLPQGVVGVLVFDDATVVVDDGSLTHPAKARS